MSLHYYPMSDPDCTQKRGRCIVLNYEKYSDPQHNRNGSHKDALKIKQTFESLNFEVLVHNDLSRKGTELVLKTIETENVDHSEYNCFVLFILAHGEPGKFLCDIEPDNPNNPIKPNHEYNYNEAFSLFDGDRCPSLNGKPKLFFVQACRGKANAHGTELSSRILHSDNYREYFMACPNDDSINPNKADRLVFCSSYSDHASMRNSNDGTWFIQDLCEVFQKNALIHDLESMLTLVKAKVKSRQAELIKEYFDANRQKEVKKIKQMPEIVSNTLIKKIKFH